MEAGRASMNAVQLSGSRGISINPGFLRIRRNRDKQKYARREKCKQRNRDGK